MVHEQMGEMAKAIADLKARVDALEEAVRVLVAATPIEPPVPHADEE